ncbi:MAG: hypothetical protein NVS3B24_03990 [Candidatus Dormibacteria bacterium]
MKILRRALVGALVSIAALAAGQLGQPIAAHAQAVFDGACTAAMTVTFPGPISSVPQFSVPFQYSGSGQCQGYPAPSSFTLTGSGTALVASCDAFGATSSSALFVFTGPMGTVTAQPVVNVGSWHDQVWLFPGVSPTRFDATATFAWTNAAEILACRQSGTASVTMTGAVAYQDPF